VVPNDVEGEALAALDRSDRRGALTILMRGYGDAVFQFCRRNLRDAASAEDVHQQVFIQAYEDLPRFSRRSGLKTWLFGIAHHRCLDAAKGNRRFLARFTSSDEAGSPEDPASPPDAGLVQRVVENAVSQCLGALAPAARSAISLRYTDGFTYEEMAAICGEKAGTLQARVARALPAVKRCLESRGVSHER
jgi:RNA polymerase sigma-70 factor (ECF subfamily)